MTTNNNEKIDSNFSEDNEVYCTTDVYKVVMLRCLEAKVIKRDTNNPKEVIFTLRHKNMPRLINLIHSGKPKDLRKFAEFHRQEMGFIQDVRRNVPVAKSAGSR